MSAPFIVPAYAGILVLIYVILAFRVTRLRGMARVGIGSGGDPRLERAIRAHANCAEYAPLALLLLSFLEMHRYSSYLLHTLCIALILGRLVHAVNISRAQENGGIRVLAMTLTFAIMIIAAIILIIDYFRIAAL